MQPAESSVHLVRRIQGGDPGAEDELVARFLRGVTFLLRELTRDEARADDLCQETFRLVLEKVRRGELREAEKLAPFIRQIARNLFIAECRKEAKHRRVGGDEQVEHSEDHGPDPLKRLLAKENARIVQRLLDDLEPRRDREILLRFLVAEQPKEQICADFGLSGLHFNRVVYRARQRLRDHLDRYHKRKQLPCRKRIARDDLG